jgi:hypothetical protein
MPETPDFERIAHLIHFEATGETLTLDADIAPIVEQLRLVWNARGAADVATIDVLYEIAPPTMKTIDRAIRTLDRYGARRIA